MPLYLTATKPIYKIVNEGNMILKALLNYVYLYTQDASLKTCSIINQYPLHMHTLSMVKTATLSLAFIILYLIGCLNSYKGLPQWYRSETAIKVE